jgi:hypothetical protein
MLNARERDALRYLLGYLTEEQLLDAIAQYGKDAVRAALEEADAISWFEHMNWEVEV